MKTLVSNRTRLVRGTRLSLALVAACACSFPLLESARADEPPATLAPNAADKETARALVGLGNDKTKQGDLAGALEAFKQAHAIMGVPTTGILLAQAHASMDHLLEAYELFVQITLTPPQSKEPAAFAKARAKSKAQADALAERIPSLVASLEAADGSALEDVKVTIDQTELAGLTATLPRKVNPGPHLVAATARGFRAEPTKVVVAEKETQTVKLVLQPLPPEPVVAPPAPPPAPVVAPPPAPVVAPPPAPVVAPPPAPVVAPLALPDAPAPAMAAYKPLIVWGSFGLGAVGLVTGAITGGMSLSAATRALDLCPSKVNCPEAARPDHDRAVTLANVSNATLVVGGLGAIAGAVSLFVLPGPLFPPTKGAGIALAPFVTPTGAGVAGSF